MCWALAVGRRVLSDVRVVLGSSCAGQSREACGCGDVCRDGACDGRAGVAEDGFACSWAGRGSSRRQRRLEGGEEERSTSVRLGEGGLLGGGGRDAQKDDDEDGGELVATVMRWTLLAAGGRGKASDPGLGIQHGG